MRREPRPRKSAEIRDSTRDQRLVRRKWQCVPRGEMRGAPVTWFHNTVCESCRRGITPKSEVPV